MASKNKKSPQSPTSKTTKKLKTLEAKKPAEPTNRPQGLTVVGIGASAGGLSALNSFFDALSPDTGMAFVVVMHLHPTYESHLAELLQQHTQMPIRKVTRKIKVEADHVYVIPPNRNIILTDTHLETAEFTEPRGKRTPIDHFFRSLASEDRESIAVILSGGGTDGSVGLKDVKELGGVIMVQHPNEAEYNSMPRAAINTGLVDVVLPAAQLAEKLVEYAQHRPQLPHDPGQLTEEEGETFQNILAQVQARTGQDFNHYKHATILRRVERRMQLNGMTTLAGYLKFLRQNANEAQSMFSDILIGVTNFFRDRKSWQALEQEVIPALFKIKGGVMNYEPGRLAAPPARKRMGLPCCWSKRRQGRILLPIFRFLHLTWMRDRSRTPERVCTPQPSKPTSRPKGWSVFSPAKAIITTSKVRFVIASSSQIIIFCAIHPSRIRI